MTLRRFAPTTLRRFAPQIALALTAAASPPAHADEGMWTFNAFPSDKVQAAYGFAPDQAWLDHVQRSSLRLAQGCSASLVSSQGLVMTNHHCARDCAYGLSSERENLVENGFYAADAAEERRCPDLEANQLVQITDVTKDIHDATDGKDGAALHDAERAAIAKAEASCGDAADVRCDVIKLYEGGRYDLYHYKRYQDLRLAWFPEDQAANFGGDPDNFNFPRYAIDAAFVRIYENGKPLSTQDFLPFSKQPLTDGELVFVSGNPGRTDRLDTLAQVEFARDVQMPSLLLRLAETRGMLLEFMREGEEKRRIALDDYFFTANSYKAIFGIEQTLTDQAFLAKKAKEEADLRAQIGRDPKLAYAVPAWDAIAKAEDRQREIYPAYVALETQPSRSAGDLMRDAIRLVRAAAEVGKPNGERLRGYTDGALPALRAQVLSPAPIYPELETIRIAAWLRDLREHLGVDDERVRRVLERDSPENLAATLATKTALRDPAARKALLDGGAAAVAASKDPLVVFVRDRLDAPARAVRTIQENEVDAVVTRNKTLIEQARFALQGASTYPDATFSARLSYGAVKGYQIDGKTIAPFTTFAGAFARQTGAFPFILPKSWNDAKDKLDGATELDVATTNDIIGGNSGSPLIDRRGQAAGLVFDGNIQSLGGDYTFDPDTYRAVSVTTAAIMKALTTIYHADRLAMELEAKTD
jgi:hypothetical protein